MSNIRAQVSLRANGPKSTEGGPKQRKFIQGQAMTLSDPEEINYYRNHPDYECALFGEEQSELAVVPVVPSDDELEVEESDELTEQELEDMEEENMAEGDVPPDMDPEHSGDQPTIDGEPDGDDEVAPVPEVAPYDEKELKGLSKTALIARAAEDSLGIELFDNMKKGDIIAAMIAARNGGG